MEDNRYGISTFEEMLKNEDYSFKKFVVSPTKEVKLKFTYFSNCIFECTSQEKVDN